MYRREKDIMRIGIDARSIAGKVCGVSRTAERTINALLEIDAVNSYVVYTSRDIGLIQKPNCRTKILSGSHLNPLKDSIFCRGLLEDRLDLLHVMHSFLPLGLPKGLKRIVTIHDLFAATDRDFFIKRKPFHRILNVYFNLLIRRSARIADKIISVTHATGNQLRVRYGVPREKISVVYNASGLDFSAERPSEDRTPQEEWIVYYLGNFRSYKNVAVLVEGFSIFVRRYDTEGRARLILAGNDRSSIVESLVKRLGLANIVEFIHLPEDAQISDLYRRAGVFVMPSRAEGFGIPVVEAMGFGVPVVISNAEALVEVAGNAAHVFNHDQPEMLAESLRRVRDDENLRREMIRLGRERAKLYSWRKCAKLLLDNYRDVVKNNSGSR